ncbi:MAG: hypothetical protein ACYSYL_16450 [Planctomycetota bacterium]|jgi:hypothetical protein
MLVAIKVVKGYRAGFIHRNINPNPLANVDFSLIVIFLYRKIVESFNLLCCKFVYDFSPLCPAATAAGQLRNDQQYKSDFDSHSSLLKKDAPRTSGVLLSGSTPLIWGLGQEKRAGGVLLPDRIIIV